MDPRTGELLALANAPNFDPNPFRALLRRQRRDRAVMDAYEPGSTYKLVTAAAALESQKVGLASRFPARDPLEVGGRTIHNAEDGFMAGTGGSETLEQIIEFSHNVGAAEMGLAIGERTFYAMDRKAGFGSPTGVGLPGENPGIVPPPSQWSGSSLATMSFGQGVSVTPLAMARYYSAIANGGLLMEPYIAQSHLRSTGKSSPSLRPECTICRVFSHDRATNCAMFCAPSSCVAPATAGGDPGVRDRRKNWNRVDRRDGVYGSGAYAASFIGMVPRSSSTLRDPVKIDRPLGSFYGGVVAAPVFAPLGREAMLHAGVLPAGPVGSTVPPAKRNPSPRLLEPVPPSGVLVRVPADVDLRDL